MSRRNLTSTRAKLAALRDGRELPLTADDVAFGTEVGDVPGPDVRAVLRLARAIHRTESTNVSISWPAQERAREFFNEHGLARTLDRATELEATVDGRLEGLLFTLKLPDGSTLETRLMGSGGEVGGGCFSAANTLIGKSERGAYLERVYAEALGYARAELAERGTVRVLDPDAKLSADRIVPTAVAEVLSVRGILFHDLEDT